MEDTLDELSDAIGSGGKVSGSERGASSQRYKLTLAYDGTSFHGWQQQSDATGKSLRTVAGVVQETLGRVLRQPIKLVGASRTDTGVHAHGQVAHFDAVSRIPLERLPAAINSRLPEDVQILSAEEAPASFDAIWDARRKRYHYRIYNAQLRPLEQRRYVWHCWVPLDEERMNRGADRLVGTHDFAGLAAAGHGRVSTVRTIFHCQVQRQGPELTIEVEGDGFLYKMVRNLSGTLADIGRGRLDPAVVDQILATGDRRLAGPTLPGCGLCLEWIRYS